MTVVVYGAKYSVYVRIVRMALAEKVVDYDLVEVDIFAPELPAFYAPLHPFGKIPAFDHDGFQLYETSAIVRYIDEAFSGPSLQPRGTREKARMNQLISIADVYFYRPAVWDVAVERFDKPAQQQTANEALIAEGLDKTSTALTAITNLMGEGSFLVGEDITLADIVLAPMIDYFILAPEGQAQLAAFSKLSSWWSTMKDRPSMTETGPAGA